MKLLMVLILLLAGCRAEVPEQDGFSVTDILGSDDATGYARAWQPRKFHFPEDHGPHPEFRNEWWYLTGQLEAQDGREFGFQVTFFRNAVSPQPVNSPSAWRTNQVWMAHAALTDLTDGKHIAQERFSRQGVGLAGASVFPFKVWLENWHLHEDSTSGSWLLHVPAEQYSLKLQLLPLSPVILQGDEGLSQKSAEPGNASYYYSIPRIAVDGELTINGRDAPVRGTAWLDREWSTSALEPGQIGWDWFSLHLEDGRNLMYYQLRKKDGSIDPYSRGSVSNRSGLVTRLAPEQIALTPLRYWDAGDRRYPIEWRMTVNGEKHPWRVRALLADQEMDLSVRYWEGAVEVVDEVTHKQVGKGYLEMVGYR